MKATIKRLGGTERTRLQQKTARTKSINSNRYAIRECLQTWKEQDKTLLVEIGSGVVTQAGLGTLHEFSPGNFAVQPRGSQSLLLLDDNWERYAELKTGDGEHETLLVSQRGPNSPWIRLSDDLGDHGHGLLAGPTEADIQMALSQLTLWAQARALIMFGSGTKIGEVTFVGRLVGPGDSDSFLVVGDPESGLRRVGGRILLRSADYVHLHREENHLVLVLRSRDGDTCGVLCGSGSPEDQMLMLKSLWKSSN